MKNRRNIKFYSIQYTCILSFMTLGFCLSQSLTTALNFQNQTSEILVRRFSNSSGEIVPKIFKVIQNGTAAEAREPSFTLKSDSVKVQPGFKTVDINVLNRLKDKENAKKMALVQEDIQSRIDKNEPEPLTEKMINNASFETINSEEMTRKQTRVKEDIESRLLHGDQFLSYQHEADDMYHYPVKRSEDDYYVDEPVSDSSLQPRMTTEAAKEEDSFFSIFESLFGSSDTESQSKKKEKPNDDPTFEEPIGEDIKDNIKTIGEIFKPLKPSEETGQPKLSSKNQNQAPEFRIVNNFHSSQTHKPYRSPQPKPNYDNFYRPVTQRPFLHYKPYPTKGYEDYDLEEFSDKKGSTITTRVKYVSPLMTSSSYTETSVNPSSTTTTGTIATTKTSTKNIYDNKVKFPSIQKKNDYFNRIANQEVKTESTKKQEEKETEKPMPQQGEIKTSAENRQTSQNNKIFETKENEVKPQKIQESPNFYNLINLPVRYSTKDTAIPLISTSYANTKIQGTGAHKYEKKSNGKYPNHKYDHLNTSTTKKPNYWGVNQVNTEKTVASFKQTPITLKTTIKHFSSSDLDNLENDDEKVGLGPVLGDYGNKKIVKSKYTNEPTRLTTTTANTDRTSVKNDDARVVEVSQKIYTVKPEIKVNKTSSIGIPKTSKKPFSNFNPYEDYDYETAETKRYDQSYPTYSNHEKEQQLKYEQYQHNYQNSPLKGGSESFKQPEVEYEYYDYEVDTLPTTTITEGTTASTSTITSTAGKIKFKYPEQPKDKLKTSSSEKVAIIVPTQNFSFYSNNNFEESKKHSISVIPSIKTTTAINRNSSVKETTTNPSESKFQTTTPVAVKFTEKESPQKIVKTTIHQPTSNLVYKEPAPVFENTGELEEQTIKPFPTFSILKITSKNTTAKDSAEKLVVVTPPIIIKDSESNKNVELIPSEDNIKKEKTEEIYFQPQQALPVQTSYHRPVGSHQSNYDFTTEFTVGAVQGPGHLTSKKTFGNNPQFQGGHFVSSSISNNFYENDEPFRPIPKPVGFSNLPTDQENAQHESVKNSLALQNKPNNQMHLSENENEPTHEPHEFIPSPQFHRPVEPKPAENNRPFDVIDYDFEGIQTEPKPGQYVIFSKPQLNPEVNSNQVRKKEEVNSDKKIMSNVPYYHEKNISNQKHVIFNPKEGQFYQSMPNLSISEKVEPNLPIYGSSEISSNDQLSLQLVPPRGMQTEKPFEGNFVVPDSEKKENIVSYPRPHWEKNGKPSFLMNAMTNKNDMIKHPPIPPQMAPTLVPPMNFPPQRFRRPTQPHSPPLRKNFNEATNNFKPKLNLPNILPQFRPNTKINGRPYHRTSTYGNSNRRNGMNLYYEKEHSNFPYVIHQPDKDIAVNREYEMGPEIVPKFITNRGKLQSELWSSQGMQKRFGQSPTNTELKLEHYPSGHLRENPKILKRYQRTPVTTLQMLKQTPGIKTQKTQHTREDNADPLAPLTPPIYKTFPVDNKKEENVYIVYPAKAPQKLHPDNNKVFVVSDTKSQKHFYNFTKNEEEHPLLISNSKVNPYNEEEFPYEFIRLGERLQMVRKQQKDKNGGIKKNVKTDYVEDEINPQKYLQEYNFRSKDDKIDMNLHMQSNNQWNEIRFNPEVNRNFNNNNNNNNNNGDNNFRFYKNSTGSHKTEINGGRPIEFRNIKEIENSAFTLGAVMHTTSDTKRKGFVSNASLQESDDSKDVSRLNVNERISNGKIITVSMPVDVKEDFEPKSNPDKYNFLAPFQASSSITTNGSNHGWTIVKHPDDGVDVVDGEGSTEISTTQFNFENFKPEFIGGFKPLYEFPDETEKKNETTTEPSTTKENVSKTR